MKAVRVDETVIKLAVQMTPDEADSLRSGLILAIEGKFKLSDVQLAQLAILRDAIGRVF